MKENMKKLYCLFAFSKEGYLRGFSSGFNKSDIGKISFEECMNGYIVCIGDDSKMSKIPSKYIESHYWKFSKDSSDLSIITDIICSK